MLTALQSKVRTEVCFLQGGFEGVSETYPKLCYNSGNNKMMTLETNSGHTTPIYKGWSSGAAALSVLRQCGPLLMQRGPGCSGHHNCARLLVLSQPVRGQTPVPAPHCGGQCGCKHKGLLLHCHYFYRLSEADGCVLLHCKAGILRSATICLEYLMHTHRVRLQEAFNLKQRRNIISANVAFMGQLLQFETDVLCQG